MELVQYNEGAFAALAASLQGDMKPILKFDKGDWLFGQDKVDVPVGTEIAANIWEMNIGWIRWHDKKLQERLMVSVNSGAKPASRDALGHLDKDLWERDKKTQEPIDPWAFTMEIPARGLSGDKLECILSGSSKGWQGACKRLLDTFGKSYRENMGKTPIVKLSVDSYDHSSYGRVKVPVMELTGWKTAEELNAATAPEPKKKATF